MEIIIDFATTRRIAAHEYQQARADIAQYGPLEAYRRSQARHDERLIEAPDAASLACQAGCSWCCHFTIDVRPVEVFRILDFIGAQYSSQEIARVRSEIEANAGMLRNLDDETRMQLNVKCPFLAEARCTIYSARPQTCRNYHATDVTGCRQSFEQPDNLDIDPDFAPWVYQIGGAHVDAFSKAMHDAGYDVLAFEMNTALWHALEDPASRSCFEAGQRTFAALDGEEVAAEFIEDDDVERD